MNFIHGPLFGRFTRSLFIGASVVGILMGFFVSPSLSRAETLDFEERQACFLKVQTFLSSFLSNDGAKDYWTDFFKRNRCQQEDIFALDEEIDSLLIQLYETSCDTDEFTQLQTEIREKKMEIYFVRHIVEVEEDTYFEKDVEAVDWALVESKLFDVMVQRYVQGKKTPWVTEEALKELFEDWSERYRDRVDSYLACEESPWQEVADKSHEFLETLREIKESFQKDTRAMTDEFEETTKQRLQDSGVLDSNGEFAGMGSAIKSYLQKNIDVQLSNLPSKQTLQAIVENFRVLGQIPSTQDAYNALQSEEFELAELSRRAQLVAEYTFLYRQAGTDITVLLRNKITALRDVVNVSTSGIKLDQSSSGSGNLKQLKAAAKGIWKKQGKTSVDPSA